MTEFRSELLCECVQEVAPLLELHHRELMQQSIPLYPRWDDYALLERMGRYTVFTARDNGLLVGYSAFYVDRHMHSAGFTFARNDVFYIREDHRGGMTAMRFLRYTHEQLKGLGAQHIGYLCKFHNNLAALLHRLGFEDEEKFVGRMI